MSSTSRKPISEDLYQRYKRAYLNAQEAPDRDWEALSHIVESLDRELLYRVATQVDLMLEHRGWVRCPRVVCYPFYQVHMTFGWGPSRPEGEDSLETTISVVTKPQGEPYPSVLATLAEHVEAPSYYLKLSSPRELSMVLNKLEDYRAPGRPSGVPQGSIPGRIITTASGSFD